MTRGYSPYGPTSLAVFGPRRKPTGSIPPSVRAEVIERDGPRCFYCPKELAPDEITLDHVRAKVRGGLGVAENLRVACLACNTSKGTRAWPYEWTGARAQ